MASVVVYGVVVWGPHLGLHITRFLSGYGALALLALGAWRVSFSGMPRRAWMVIGAGALAFRIICLTEGPQLSDDIYRYIWDGRILLEGINPYRYPPSAPELAAYRDALWPLINNPHLPTIYPPLLQGVFAAAAWIHPSVFAMKALITLLDLGAGWLLFLALRTVHREHWAVLYWWHPAVVFEFSGQGHADAAGVFCVALGLYALTRERRGLELAALSAAALVKFFAALAWPGAARAYPRRAWILPALVAVGYIPFALQGVNPLGSLGTFASHWRANAFLFEVWDGLPGVWPRVVSLFPAAVLALAGALRGWPWPRTLSLALGTFLLCSPVVHPWYVLWLLPLGLWERRPAWVAWAFLAPLTYWVLPEFLNSGVWEERAWVNGLVIVPVLALLAWPRRGGRKSG